MNPRLQEMIAKARALAAEKETTNPPLPNTVTIQNKYGEAITLNSKQLEAVNYAKSNKSFCLIGAAGTGKTTSVLAVIEALCNSDLPTYQSDGHRHLTTSGTPGIVGCAYTRTAVINLKKSMPAKMLANTLPSHALLEFAPVFIETFDSDGNLTVTRTFEPKRNKLNPLPDSIRCIIVEEASMPSIELYTMLLDAIQHPVQFIFIGDINQLPPVFGSAVLGFAMLDLPVVQLTEVYRNAGPIISFAHRILSGKQLPQKDFANYEAPDSIKIQTWQKSLHADDACHLAAKAMCALIDSGQLSVATDIILCPFNKAFGTIELNNVIANHLALSRSATTYEIITGFSTKYFAEGDRVMYDKEFGYITKIAPNTTYAGKVPQTASPYLDRWGINNKPAPATTSLETEEDIDSILNSFSSVDHNDEVKRQASHAITISLDNGEELLISSAGEINSLALGYAITVHKAQGNEWRKVVFALHQSHATMLSRELLYTGVTRAAKQLHIICEKNTFIKGINSQKIKGDTLADKAEFFKGKAIDSTLIANLRWG